MELDDYLKLPYTITLKPDEDGDWVAEIEELEGCAAHGGSQAEALSRLDEAKGLWIEEAISNGQPVPKPSATELLPSGRFVQRVPRSLHKNLTKLAKIEGTSLNQLVTSILSHYVGGTRRQVTVMNLASGFAWFNTMLQMGSTTTVTWTNKEGGLGQFTGGVANILSDFEKVGSNG